MFEEYRRYGVIQVSGTLITLFKGYADARYISMAQPVEWAQWQGCALIVKFKGDDRHLYRVTSWGGGYDIIYL